MNPSSFNLHVKNEQTLQGLKNVVGVIPGKSKKDEYVVFSGHYDHLGIGKPDKNQDSIFNGANDDAAGTTAVMMLAKYFSEAKDNERTLVFVAFTAEEIGGFGSRYFSKQMNPDKVMAMFNIEMIGTESKWGTNSAYITGYEKSDMGKILQANLQGSKFHFEPDPYPKQNLFYRSDNATLAALGVPAHTISTSKMEEAPNNEPNYHKQSDEIGTLDMNNMAEIIKAIAISSKTIVSGKDTPTRVEKQK
jgi:Zn-dependent M28 family amino/carboxypeptidase